MKRAKGVGKAAVAVLSFALISGCAATDSSPQGRGKGENSDTKGGGKNSIGIDLSDGATGRGSTSVEYDEGGESLVHTGGSSSGGSGASGSSSDGKSQSSPKGSGSTRAEKQKSVGTSKSPDVSRDKSGSSSDVGNLIRGHASGRCVNVSGSNGTGGTLLDIMDCGGGARMEWEFMPDGTIRAIGECMEVAGGATENGANIQLADCDGSTAQHFVLNASHDLVNPHSHKCVDVKDQLMANASRLQLWTCNGQRNQKWSKS